MEETRGGMAGALGLDPVVVISHSDHSAGCRVIVLAKRSAGHQSDHRPLAFKAKPYMRYLEAGPQLVGTVPKHLAGHLPPRREIIIIFRDLPGVLSWSRARICPHDVVRRNLAYPLNV
jgi:hypothetical protein